MIRAADGATNGDWSDAVKIHPILRGLSTTLLGAARYGLTLALFCFVWWYDARYLNQAFDANLAIIKTTTGLVDSSGKSEAMLRAFAAEKMLLFGEGSAAIWAVGLAVAAGMRRLMNGRAAAKTIARPLPRGPA